MPVIHLVFEIIIYSGLLITAGIAVFLLRRVRTKKGFVYKHLGFSYGVMLFCLVCFILLFWGSFIESRRIVYRHTSLDVESVTEPITVALIADLQVGPYKRTGFVKRVVQKIQKANPDIVFIAGDHIDNSGSTYNELSFLQPLKTLAEAIPTYAVHGNHDYGIVSSDPDLRFPDMSEETKEYMESLGITYLVNQLEKIEVNNDSFYVYGTDAWWSGNTNFDGLKERTQNLPTIVLNHNPSATQTIATYDVDLLVSGHTHGGQIRFPFIGPLMRVDFSLPLSWEKGAYNYKNLNAYTTSGVGESGTRARLFNPPEIVLITLH